MAGNTTNITSASRSKEGSPVEVNIEHADNVTIINFGDVKEEIDVPDKRLPPSKKKPIPLDELETMTSFVLAGIQEEHRDLVEIDFSKARVLMPDEAGRNLYKQEFTPVDVASTIYALDPIIALKQNQRVSAQLEEIILTTVNGYYPKEGQIDVRGYFDSGYTLRD